MKYCYHAYFTDEEQNRSALAITGPAQDLTGPAQFPNH